jgi:flagellar basal-body rod protein FlgB
MATDGIFDNTIGVLDKVLELRSRKLEVISANIANAETPGYARLRMDFEEALQQAAAGSDSGQAVTHPRHMPAAMEDAEPRVWRELNKSGIGDDNNVSLDREMVDLADNQIRYEAAIRMLNKKFGMLKLVIQERV